MTGAAVTTGADGVAGASGATKVRPSPSGINPFSGSAPYSTSRKSPVSS